MKKTLKQLSFIGLTIMIVLASCTMEKRVYTSGYHIEWLKGKHNPNKNELVNNTDSKKSDENKAVPAWQSKNTTTPFDKTSGTTETVNNDITSSAGTKSIILAPHKSVSLHKSENVAKVNSVSETETMIKQASKKQNKTKSKGSSGGGKSQLVALLLCIFVGALGIHRFYLGYIGIGVIQLLTLGACGIWSLIDLIMIITGDLKPKDGDYDKKL